MFLRSNQPVYAGFLGTGKEQQLRPRRMARVLVEQEREREREDHRDLSRLFVLRVACDRECAAGE
jgi:hypothetical protein